MIKPFYILIMLVYLSKFTGKYTKKVGEVNFTVCKLLKVKFLKIWFIMLALLYLAKWSRILTSSLWDESVLDGIGGYWSKFFSKFNICDWNYTMQMPFYSLTKLSVYSTKGSHPAVYVGFFFFFFWVRIPLSWKWKWSRSVMSNSLQSHGL